MSPYRSAGFAALMVLAAFAPALAQKQSNAPPASTGAAVPQTVVATGGVSLEVSQGKLIVLPTAASSVFIADPTIADVQLANSNHVFVYGKKAGRTSLYAMGADGAILQAVAVEVAIQSGHARAAVRATPGATDIHVTDTDAGVILEGTAANPAAAAGAVRSTTENAPEKAVIDDRVKIKGSAQVTLRVRIAEVSRVVTKELGFNWNALINNGIFQYGLFTGRMAFINGVFQQASPTSLSASPGSLIIGSPSGDADAVIDALAEEGLLTILAEPTLTALSGETASFLAGGEFPIPVSQALGTISIQFQPYGVGLNFVPTVMATNHISLRVRPEVSQITSQGAITINGLQIPALTVRRAETTIELGSGQSFAIAGLLQDNTNNDVQRFPGLGDLPVLGTMFRSTSFQRQESELLIVVTPYIVRPIDDPRSVRLPTDAWQPASDIERVFYGLSADPYPQGMAPYSHAPRSGVAPPPHLMGAAGFEVE
jgi:pilus assembly protein CpaC